MKTAILLVLGVLAASSVSCTPGTKFPITMSEAKMPEVTDYVYVGVSGSKLDQEVCYFRCMANKEVLTLDAQYGPEKDEVLHCFCGYVP